MSVVTVKLWNYCMYSCDYCVSHSNRKVWDPVPFIAARDVLDVPSTLDWIGIHRTESSVHISGGEPLLRPDIETIVNQCLDRGFETTIFTNGQLLHNHQSLFDLPVGWVLTWHQSEINAEVFLKEIAPLRDKKIFVNTILPYDPNWKVFEEDKKVFYDNGFDLYPRINWWNMQTADLWELKPTRVENIASNYLTLIEPNGMVFPCNSWDWGPIGNVYSGECNDSLARSIDDHAEKCCIVDRRCGAFLTAQMAELLWK